MDTKNPSERFDYIPGDIEEYKMRIRYRKNEIYIYGFNSECIMKNVLKKDKKGYKIIEDIFAPITKKEFKMFLEHMRSPFVLEEEIRARERYFYANGEELPKESELIKQEGWLPWYSVASRI